MNPQPPAGDANRQPASPGAGSPSPNLDRLDVEAAARAARAASRIVAALDTQAKNALLLDLADTLDRRRAEVLAANAQDLDAAGRHGLAEAKLQRLALSDESLAQMARGVRQVAALPDPVDQVTQQRTLPNGLELRRVRTPLGVIAMIYEARPGVTIDAFALCFKAGNACVLKGGKEAARCNAVLASIVRERLAAAGLPAHAITALPALGRDELRELLQLDQFIDLVIPRGGTDLIRFVAEHSSIPTIQHYHGVCHVFVDASADPEMARRIVLNGKTSAPATCNATECLLVDASVAQTMVPFLTSALVQAGVEVRADARALEMAPGAKAAAPEDFGREFLDKTIALRVVAGLEEAIAHIERFGSNHTEAIVTQNPEHARVFCRRVTASCVLVNASTRFNDGFQLGLGAEIGISTTKVHAYGPMGLEELTTQRFVVAGQGQVR
jgi:glutamate-5-semialdehyde dehydrogenase